MAKVKIVLACTSCRQQVAQWVGRCPGCGAWGTIEESSGVRGSAGGTPLVSLAAAPDEATRVSSGFAGIDRVLGGGIVPASVALLAGEPGIGKSTLLLQMLAHLSDAGHRCLLVSGEESHAQVAARAQRLGVSGDDISFAPGRDLAAVIDTARAAAPFVLAVDSIQTIRDVTGTQMPGGTSQVRLCADALIGLAKTEGIAVLLTGHVTKDGDLAGPRALEHAVDVVLTFDGDPRSGLRVLSGGKNRYGAEGETAWFEMGGHGLREIDPTELLVSHDRSPGAAVALPQAGRRALAVEVQALVGSTEGPARRQATGLDLRRFQLVAAVVDRAAQAAAGARGAVRRVLGRGAPGRSRLRPGHRGRPGVGVHGCGASRRLGVRRRGGPHRRHPPGRIPDAAAGRRTSGGVFGRLRGGGSDQGSTGTPGRPGATSPTGAGLGVPAGRPVGSCPHGVDPSDPSDRPKGPLTCGFGLRCIADACYLVTS